MIPQICRHSLHFSDQIHPCTAAILSNSQKSQPTKSRGITNRTELPAVVRTKTDTTAQTPPSTHSLARRLEPQTCQTLPLRTTNATVVATSRRSSSFRSHSRGEGDRIERAISIWRRRLPLRRTVLGRSDGVTNGEIIKQDSVTTRSLNEKLTSSFRWAARRWLTACPDWRWLLACVRVCFCADWL